MSADAGTMAHSVGASRGQGALPSRSADWLPIHLAPRTGERIELSHEKNLEAYKVTGFWCVHSRRWFLSSQFAGTRRPYFFPTHFRPLDNRRRLTSNAACQPRLVNVSTLSSLRIDRRSSRDEQSITKEMACPSSVQGQIIQ